MRKQPLIDSKFADDEQVSTGVNVQPVLPASLQDDDESQAIRIYDGGIASTDIKAEALAHELGITFQKLSDYRTGKRPVTFYRVIRFIRKNPDAAMFIIGELCELAGLAPPKKKRTVTKRDAERQLTLELRRLAPVFELLRRNAAESLGTDEEGIDDALDEVTQERRFG